MWILRRQGKGRGWLGGEARPVTPSRWFSQWRLIIIQTRQIYGKGPVVGLRIIWWYQAAYCCFVCYLFTKFICKLGIRGPTLRY